MEEQRRWKALAAIQASREGRHYQALLAERREALRDQLEGCRDPAEIPRLQARAELLGELLEELARAPDVVRQRFH